MSEELLGRRMRLPHVCGGEPDRKAAAKDKADVFPTCVGVNRGPDACGPSLRRAYPLPDRLRV